MGRRGADRLGGCAAYSFPDCGFEEAVLWASWYVWQFLLDDQFLGLSCGEFIARTLVLEEIILTAGADGPQEMNGDVMLWCWPESRRAGHTPSVHVRWRIG